MARLKILVVEDNADLADIASFTLDDLGYDVMGPAPDVAQALSLLIDSQPDGALVDLNLAGEPSYSVLDALVEKQVPLVVLTGYDGSMIPARYASLKRCTKPVSISDAMSLLFS